MNTLQGYECYFCGLPRKGRWSREAVLVAGLQNNLRRKDQEDTVNVLRVFCLKGGGAPAPGRWVWVSHNDRAYARIAPETTARRDHAGVEC